MVTAIFSSSHQCKCDCIRTYTRVLLLFILQVLFSICRNIFTFDDTIKKLTVSNPLQDFDDTDWSVYRVSLQLSSAELLSVLSTIYKGGDIRNTASFSFDMIFFASQVLINTRKSRGLLSDISCVYQKNLLGQTHCLAGPRAFKSLVDKSHITMHLMPSIGTRLLTDLSHVMCYVKTTTQHCMSSKVLNFCKNVFSRKWCKILLLLKCIFMPRL